jgi:DNA-directed RNA polymerase specialized sigma24 family protein
MADFQKEVDDLMSLQERESRQRNGQHDDETNRLERDIVEIVYRHLYEALRPQIVARYGATVGGKHASTRFTELLNEFFVRVLERFPDVLAKTRTARDLRNYVSRAMTNLMVDRCRRAKHERSDDDELRGCLVDDRQQHLNRECPGLIYGEVLETLTAWAGGTRQQQRMAEVIQREFVSGDHAEAVQRDLGISKSEFYRLRSAALNELRRAVG